jgi:S-DNA-T family DNA segregation ATPase FtsK/SpoIIIE
MPAKKTLKPRKKEDVISAIGVFISLLALLVMFSSNTHLWGLAYGIDFILGFAGFWFFCPFLFFVGFHMTWKRKLPKIPTKRLVWAYFFLFVGTMLLLSHLGSNGQESYGDTTLFLDEIAKAKSGENGGLIFDTKLGGGMVGYILAGLLNQSVGGWLVILTLALCLAVGLIILFFPQIKLLFRTIKAKIAISKAKKHNAVPSSEAEPLQEEGISFGSVSSEPLPAPAAESATPVAVKPEPKPEVVLTRRSLYANQPIPSTNVPREVSKAPSPIGNLQTSGLQPALFPGDDALETPEVPAPAPVEETSAPEPEAPAPAPEQNMFAPANPFEDKPEVVEAPLTPNETESESSAPLAAEESVVTPEPEPEPEPAPVAARPAPAPRVIPTPAPQPEPVQEEPEEDLNNTNNANDGVAQPKAVPLPAYRFPPLTLLKVYPPDESAAQNEADTAERTEIINTTFANLHVGARVVSHTIGPSVTRYDVQTDPSVSVTTIGKYVQDISVRLGGVSTRFEEMVRGKSTSGLEIANHATTIVSFKEMISALPKGDKNNLVIPFGKSISGDYVYADLSDFPHMLVAGTTGSGKSIFMHGVIMSLIMRNRPEDLRIVVVDPKRVEMAKYKDLPHLLCPIVSDGGAAKVCLDKLIEEMERRYLLFEMAGVSNIRQFNKEYAPAAGVQTLPFIVVFVDEYADLSDQCKDIAGSVVRIAQKARAAGIHLVIATQRPSVQVITGVIKANLGVRVALSVASPTDSVTILNQGGAEQLAGHGDMLIECPLISRVGLTRVQGCLVDNQEIKDVCAFIKKEHPTVYDPRFLDLTDHSKDVAPSANVSAPSAAQMRDASAQEKYNYIKETIMGREYTSISQIQREFGVGFPRAGKIFAQLQKEGIVATQTESASSSKGCRSWSIAILTPSKIRARPSRPMCIRI